MLKRYIFKKSQYLSPIEEKLAKFCQENGIKYEKTPGDKKNLYSFSFEPHYLDSVEKEVIAYCDKHGIGYTFVIDEDGIHHFNFDHLVNPEDKNPYVRKNFGSSCDVTIRNRTDNLNYILEAVDSVLSKAHEDSFEKEYGEIKWWHWLFCFIPGYYSHLKAKKRLIEEQLYMTFYVPDLEESK